MYIEWKKKKKNSRTRKKEVEEKALDSKSFSRPSAPPPPPPPQPLGRVVLLRGRRKYWALALMICRHHRNDDDDDDVTRARKTNYRDCRENTQVSTSSELTPAVWYRTANHHRVATGSKTGVDFWYGGMFICHRFRWVELGRCWQWSHFEFWDSFTFSSIWKWTIPKKNYQN